MNREEKNLRLRDIPLPLCSDNDFLQKSYQYKILVFVSFRSGGGVPYTSCDLTLNVLTSSTRYVQKCFIFKRTK